jgi:hypothetical protein
VSVEIAVMQEGDPMGRPIRTRIVGRVWRPGRKYFPLYLVGRTAILEVAGRRMAMFLSNTDGQIARTSGVLEGFPDLKG